MEYRDVGCIENLDTFRISSPTNRYSTGGVRACFNNNLAIFASFKINLC